MDDVQLVWQTIPASHVRVRFEMHVPLRGQQSDDGSKRLTRNVFTGLVEQPPDRVGRYGPGVGQRRRRRTARIGCARPPDEVGHFGGGVGVQRPAGLNPGHIRVDEVILEVRPRAKDVAFGGAPGKP